MKEHLRNYFPERFQDDGGNSLVSKALNLLSSTTMNLRKIRCEYRVINILQESDEIRLLTGAMRKYGCHFDVARHISCERCTNCAAGFDPDTKQIVICHTSTAKDNAIMSAIMHEMIHMFDYCRFKFDFNNLEHIACSEIRAANITNCSILDRIWHGGPGLLNFKQTHQYCVKDMAFNSVKAFSPETSDENIWQIIDKVFPSCYNDMEPFGRRATNGIREMKQSYRERYLYGYV